NVPGVRLDIDEDRAGAEAANSTRGGEESKRRRDHLVAGPDLQGGQGEQQGVGAGRAADRVRDAAVAGDLPFEAGDLGALDDLAGGEAPGDGGLEVGLEPAILGLQVAQRYRPAAH